MGNRNYEYVERILQSSKVRDALRKVRDRKARAINTIAASERTTVTVTLSEGTRPKGRPYARISLPASTEFGDSKTRRLRLLGRVVNL